MGFLRWHERVEICYNFNWLNFTQGIFLDRHMWEGCIYLQADASIYVHQPEEKSRFINSIISDKNHQQLLSKFNISNKYKNLRLGIIYLLNF